jgi:serine/threonine protein kinase/tetratricopeptide (TPR) repeat protein
MIGQRLSHYRIVDQIGAGGMGVVYLAHDEQLDRDVAIKVLYPGSLADERARKRFRKEALSLARLNHPNIATVHEFGSHDGSDFLVTEHIAGTSVDAKIAQGPASADEVLRLGMQLAEGLSAAHRQGIVHRDLKPGNLCLTTDGRLKIIDFGIAQFLPHRSEFGFTETVSQQHELTGTLPYMAPEQLRGEVADTRSDIWSAGVVLYELATGRRPFAEANAGVLVNSIQNERPVPPSQVNPAVSQGLERVILKALEKDPKDRYQTASTLAFDLEGLASPGRAALAAQPKRWRVGLALGGATALLAVAVVAAIGAYLSHHRNKASDVASSEANRRRTIAVLGFKNLSGKPEESWLSTALSEMLTTELSQGDQLRTIPGESVAKMKLSLALPEADSFSRQTLSRIRQNLGSDDVVLGSYLMLGDGQLRLDLRMQDAAAGETLVSVSEKGKVSEIDQLVSRAGAELRGKLGIGGLSEMQLATVRASLPSNPEAARLYSEGLQRLRLFDALSAVNLLKQAAALDPEFAPTYSGLAEAWFTLGYESKAKDQARRALDLSTRFSREERLLIEGRAHELSGETAQAIESYRALWQMFPDNLDYGLFLIRTQIRGHSAEAEKTLAELRKLSVSEADAARIDLAQANIAASQGDFKQLQSLAEQAANRGRAIGANLLVAQALQLEGHAWELMGQPQKTIELSNEARGLYVAAGDRRGAALTLLTVGDVLVDKGDLEGGKKQFEEALPVFQEIGAQRSIRSALERIGNVYYSEGKLHESEKYFEQAMRFDREINDTAGLASDYGNLANALDGLGDLSGALKMQQQSLAAFNEVGDRRGASETLNNLGNLFIEMGDLDEARRYFERSLALHREIAYRRGEVYPIAGLGDALLAQGDLAGARKQYEQALALCKEMNDEDFTAQLDVSLATIALVEKRYSDGTALARQAVMGYEKAHSAANVAWSQAVLARNLLGLGKLEEAQGAATKATALSQQTAGLTPRFEAVLADARVKAKSGKAGEARKELESMLASTRKFGYRSYEYQARLALAEIELWSGLPSAGAHLAALETEARTHGLLLVANQAHTLLQT